MISRSDLLKSPEYWFEEAQNELYRQVTEYMEEEGLNQTQLAEKLNVTKGYVSQILKGEFNYTLKKLIELSLAIKKIPKIEYKTISEILVSDEQTKFFPYSDQTSGSSLPTQTLTHPAVLTLNKFYTAEQKVAS